MFEHFPFPDGDSILVVTANAIFIYGGSLFIVSVNKINNNSYVANV